MRHKQYNLTLDSHQLRLVFVIHSQPQSGSLFMVPTIGFENGVEFQLKEETQTHWCFEDSRLFVPTINWWMKSGRTLKVRTTNYSIGFLRDFWCDLREAGWTPAAHGLPTLPSGAIRKALLV